MDNGELVLGVSQIVSSLFLGGIAIMYSRKVALIETDRKELEKKREKVELLSRMTNFQGEIALHGATIGFSLEFSGSENNISLDNFEKIADRYEELSVKDTNISKSKEDIAKIAFSEVYDFSLFEKIQDKKSSLNKRTQTDQDLFMKVLLLIDLLTIRNDTGDHSTSIKFLQKKSNYFRDIVINEKNPLVYAIENRTYLLSLMREINKISSSITKS